MEKFPSEVHGVVDYLTAGTLMALPRLFGWNNRLKALLSGAALGTVAYSLFTDYELGLVKAIPFKAHLMIDVMQGVFFCASPLLFQDEEPEVLATLVGVGLMELAVTALTYPEAYREDWANELTAPAGEYLSDAANRGVESVQNWVAAR